MLPFSQTALNAQEKSNEATNEFESRKRARQVTIPTDDGLVMAKLRELGEPIILFGEDPVPRRERLRDVMVRKGIFDALPKSNEAIPTHDLSKLQEQDQEPPDELF